MKTNQQLSLKKVIFSIFIFLLLAGYHLSQGQSKPFPQALSYPNCIKPSNVTQTAMNSSVTTYYNYWKATYLKNNLASLPGGYYVKGDITGDAEGYTPLGSSEGQGYGMVITVLMAGYDPNAKTIYDGLFKTARAYKSSANSNLMGWVVADASSAQGHFGSATDGDLDIAYSLILAHYQWGSNGTINYLAEAQKMINSGLKVSYVTNTNRLNLGDWQNKSTTDTRPSDWMMSHFKAYKSVTNDATWDNVSNATYDLINAIQTNYSSTTGLMPDFATGNPVHPAAPNFLESANDGDYYYNACRTPLRFVMDYALYGDTRGKTAANKIISWAKTTTGGTPGNFKAGYKLSGANISGNNYSSAVFVAPVVAAATCDPAHQAYLNSGWNTITGMKEGYFEDTYNLMCMLYISGNWWIPQSGGSNQAPTVSITSPANNATFTAPASVTINANAADADGTISKVEFYNGSTLLNSDNASPYSYAWTNVAAGNYTLTAKAYDNAGTVTTSAAVVIIVNTTSNQLPTVNITSPATNASFTAPANITINANASDADGSVAKVEFFNGSTKLGEDATSPYSYAWSNVAAGTYSLTAKATDNLGAVATSSAITITVTNPVTQSPYGGTVRDIPGKIEAEHYDLGGEGIAFHDLTSGNSGNAFRTDAVDIEATTDAGTGYNVGWVQAGEWLEYTVNVTTAGTYTIQARVAAISAGKYFHIELDGQNISGQITVPNTGGWQTWQTVTVSTPALTTGQKILRVAFDQGDLNLNHLTFTSSVPNNPPTVSITSPAAGASFNEGDAITINADAADSDGSIAKVEFFRGATKIGEDATSPYSVVWTGATAGTYALTAKATDDKGAMTTSTAVSITVVAVPNNPPTVSISSPTSGASFTEGNVVTINADAADSDGSIAKVEFFVGSTKIGEDATSPYSFNWTATPGNISLTAKATDNKGATTTSAVVTITVTALPNNPPTVSITSPADGASFTQGTSITINANAADTDGSVTKVEFFSGATKLGEDATSPYSFNWTGAAVGTYSLTAKATDNKGATTTSATISITVKANTNTCSGVATYTENGGYVAGSRVQNAGSQYECKPYPYTGWCNGAAWAYAPGTGSYWQDAWTLVGPCNARNASISSTEMNNMIKTAPNPFGNNTIISITVESAGEASVIVYDQFGREVAVLANGFLNADTYSFNLDGTKMQAGMYVCKFIHNGKVASINIAKQ